MRLSTLEKLLFLIFDILALSFCFALLFPIYQTFTVLVVLAWLFLFICTGLYRKWYLLSRTTHVLCILRAVCIAFGFILAAMLGDSLIPVLKQTESFDSSFFLIRFKRIFFYAFSVWFSVSFFRLAISFFLRKCLTIGWGAEPVIILGATQEAREYIQLFNEHPKLGKKVIGIVEEIIKNVRVFENLPILGIYSDLPNLIKNCKVQSIIIAGKNISEKKVNEILFYTAHLPVHIYFIPNLYEYTKNFKISEPILLQTKELQELFVLNLLPWQVSVKRIMDILIAIILIIGTLPITILTAIAIKLDSKGDVFYKQIRIGLHSRPFTIYKFRSMKTDAEKDGAQWAKRNDNRITRIGKIIRKFRIDEIPQLLCVLKGSMSMVGPRPERGVFIDKLRKTIPFYTSRLKMKPGITGWAQVRHHYDNDIEDVKVKLNYDMYYLSNFSILLDIQILIRTVYVVIFGKGAN